MAITYETPPQSPSISDQPTVRLHTVERPSIDQQETREVPRRPYFVGPKPTTTRELDDITNPRAMTDYDLEAILKPTEEIPVPGRRNIFGEKWYVDGEHGESPSLHEARVRKLQAVSASRQALGRVLHSRQYSR